MNPTATITKPAETIAELLAELGDISPERVRWIPTPGTATEQDVIRLNATKDSGLFEMVDGTLVEKAVGFAESVLALALGELLRSFVRTHKLGIVGGADGSLKLAPKLVRLPDLCFISWDQLPDRKVPMNPVPELYPELAVEVLSVSNTPKEMLRKRQDYFTAGSKLVWLIDPRQRTVAVYTSVDDHQMLTEADTLDGGCVLSGFVLPLRELFAELDSHPDSV